LIKYLKGHEGNGLSGEYFTSGSDYFSESNFTWCTSNLTFDGKNNISWAEGEPSSISITGAVENCVTVNLRPGKVKQNVLLDADCNDKQRYICEVIYEQ